VALFGFVWGEGGKHKANPVADHVPDGMTSTLPAAAAAAVAAVRPQEPDLPELPAAPQTEHEELPAIAQKS
jgi:hypothetical protein